jgi:tRNA (guanine-N7-)-methyltransferase
VTAKRRRRRVRHHVNPLRSDFLARRATPLALPDASTDVEVELGCADARFLFERAPRHPRTLFIGLEIRQPLVAQVNREAAALGVPNLRAHFAHVNLDLPWLFADGRLARLFLNFPDPWFKRRHHKRRVVTPEFAAVLAHKLRPGGELFFQSDVWDLALDAMAALEDEPRLQNVDGPWTFARANPYDARSLREVRVSERGLRVWRMRYVRRLTEQTGSVDPNH